MTVSNKKTQFIYSFLKSIFPLWVAGLGGRSTGGEIPDRRREEKLPKTNNHFIHNLTVSNRLSITVSNKLSITVSNRLSITVSNRLSITVSNKLSITVSNNFP